MPQLRKVSLGNNRMNANAEIRFGFDSAVVNKLAKVTASYKLTPYLYSQCIFAILLHKYTGRQRFSIAYPVAIREGAHFIYGGQVNLNLITYDFAKESTVPGLLKQVRDFFTATIKSDIHSGYYPITDILQANDNNDSLSQVFFTQAYFRDKSFSFEGIEKTEAMQSLRVDDGTTENTLVFEHDPTRDKLDYRAKYNQGSVNTELLHAFINGYKKLFIDVLDDLANGHNQQLIAGYSLLSVEHYQQLVYGFNQTKQYCSPTKTLHQLFEDQVNRTPNNVAVAYEDETWTYAQLNEDSNQLAHYLRNNVDSQPDDVIGLCLRPGYHRIMALWAVLKSGAAYLPIDTALPNERINYLLSDTKAAVIITNRHDATRFNHIIEQDKVSVINLDAQPIKTELFKQSNENPNPITQPHHLAYVIYTSGTQGQPKGVLLEHRSVVNYTTSIINDNQLSETNVWAQYVSFSFDFSVLEIYPILLSGGKLCIIKDEDRMDCRKVNDFFHQHEVTFAFLPTPFAELFFELKNTSLKKLFVGGSKLSKYIQSSYQIINAYGPTEATVHATQFLVDRAYESFPIGKPLSNVTCYVVDTHLNLLPVGAIGELLIGGEGLARGYLNLPDVTAQKFIRNPFQSEQEKFENKNARLYRTGDLVRWLPNGNLAYIGRNDDQIKIRGHRIELSEIEYGLMQYPGIQQAAVIAADRPDQSNEKHIAAYYAAQMPLDHANLKEHLSKQFPAYMLPTAYMHVQKMPLSTSGKINKRALPTPKWDDAQSYVAPNTIIEKIVCAAYAKTLGLEENQVGISHDFFELGGNSLLAIRLTFLLGNHLKISATDIFKLKTPAKLVLMLPPAKENFLQQSLQIKLSYQNKITYALQDIETRAIDQNVLRQYQQYLERTRKLNLDIFTRSNIQSVFLTGATGFLGCHLLATLLEKTSYTIYLPVRAASDAAAFDRLNQKFKHYFKTGLENKLNRIMAFAAHLNQENLGLEPKQYEAMATQVGSIIHCASLVKYFGRDEEFHQSNIQPTTQLLELAKLTRNRDFHYISTVGVVFDGHVTDSGYSIFTEEDDLKTVVGRNHPYIQSKYKAEQLVCQARSQGVNGTIYRIGNLVMNSQTLAIQENYEGNMFFAHLNALVDFKIIPEEIAQMEVSPVDYTASAIVKLFDKATLLNQTHHVFNPNVVNLRAVLTYFMDLREQENSMEKFIEKVITSIELSNDTNIHTSLFMLYQFWLYQIDEDHTTVMRIAQNKTERILDKLGFQWPILDPVMFQELMNKILRQ